MAGIPVELTKYGNMYSNRISRPTEKKLAGIKKGVREMKMVDILGTNTENINEAENLLEHINTMEWFGINTINDKGESNELGLTKTMARKYCKIELKRLKKQERKLKKLIALRYLIPKKALEE